jgi:hypothetical protein
LKRNALSKFVGFDTIIVDVVGHLLAVEDDEQGGWTLLTGVFP